MTARQINPPGVYDGSAVGLSQAVVDPPSGLVFVSGQVAWDVHSKVVGKTVGEQAKVALDNLTLVLAAAGCGAADVLSLRVYVRGEIAAHMAEAGPALAAFLGAARPALTGVGVASLATPETLVEIEAVARVPKAS